MKSNFKRNNKVQSKHYGRGTVVKVKSDKTITYPVEVGFDESGLIRYFTRDGKYAVDETSDKDITLVSNVDAENNTVLNLSQSKFRVGSRVKHRKPDVNISTGEVVAILDNGADYPVLILWDFHRNVKGLFKYGEVEHSISTDLQGKRWSSDAEPIIDLIQY